MELIQIYLNFYYKITIFINFSLLDPDPQSWFRHLWKRCTCFVLYVQMYDITVNIEMQNMWVFPSKQTIILRL